MDLESLLYLPLECLLPGSARVAEHAGITYLAAGYVEVGLPVAPCNATWYVYVIVPTEHPWHDLRTEHPILPPECEWSDARTDLCASVGRRELASAGRWLGRLAVSDVHAAALGEWIADAAARAWPSNLGLDDLQPLLLDPRQELREFALGLLPLMDAEARRGRYAPVVSAWRATVTTVVRTDDGDLYIPPPVGGFELVLDAAGEYFLRYPQSLRERTELQPRDWVPVEDAKWDGWESACRNGDARPMGGCRSAGRTSLDREYLRSRAFLVYLEGELSPASPMERR